MFKHNKEGSNLALKRKWAVPWILTIACANLWAVFAAFSAPTIMSQPQSQAVAVGAGAAFTVTATGDGQLGYQWLKDGLNLNDGGRVTGVATTDLFIANASTNDSGGYAVVVTDGSGSTTSQVAVLTVAAPPSLTITVGGGNAVISWPNWVGGLSSELQESSNLNDWAVVGISPSSPFVIPLTAARRYFRLYLQDTLYSANVVGYANVLVKVGVPNQISDPFIADDNQISTVISYAPDSSMVWKGEVTNYTSGAWFDPYFSEWYDSIGGPSTMVLNPGEPFWFENDSDDTFTNLTFVGEMPPPEPQIRTQPQDQAVVADDTASFYVGAAGESPLLYQWRYEGAELVDQTNATLLLVNVKPTQAGHYSVIVSNAFGTITSSEAFLRVAPIAITTQPQSQTAFRGGSAAFSVSARGPQPISYQWKFEDTGLVGETNSTLVLANVQPSQAGHYSVVVSNSLAIEVSSNALLTVVPILITAQPQDQTVVEWGSATLAVAAQGAPPLSYQWLLDGNSLPGATNSTLALSFIQKSQDGGYSVIITNSHGSATSSVATLSVSPAAVLGDVVISTNATWPANNYSVHSLLVQNSAQLTLPGGSVVAVSGDVIIATNAQVVCASTNNQGQENGQWAGAGVTLLCSNLRIDAGGSLDAFGQGYGPRLGPGAGSDGWVSGSGAGYGGQGGTGDDYYGPGGAAYGDLRAPTALGSGGGGSIFAPGGAGGGAIRAIVRGSLTVDGELSADAGYYYYWYPYTGGPGSGGSLYVEAGSLRGSGRIQAMSWTAITPYGSAGGGGGGRIAIYYTNSTFGGSISATGGGGTQYGGAGTIFLQNRGAGTEELRIVDLGTLGAPTPVGSYTNLGTLMVDKGARFVVNGAFDNEGVISVPAGSELDLNGDYAGGARSPLQNLTDGKVMVAGGSAQSPRLIEAMSLDQGAIAQGFSRNFAFGTLEVSNQTYVKLVDRSDNYPGAGPEAVYINALTLDPGAALDLNGVPLYVRSLLNQATVVNGQIQVLPDGGAIEVGSPTPGGISTNLEMDVWTFFARAGRTITVELNPGLAGLPAPAQPYLDYGRVELRDAGDVVLEVAENGSPQEMARISGFTVPEDGLYKVVVCSPTAMPTKSGNYMLALWDVTIRERPLQVNQPCVGSLEFAYAVDRWSFSAAAGTLMQLQVTNQSGPPVYFTLTGPNGWVGFSNLTSSGDLVSLPYDGRYALLAECVGQDSGSRYNCRLVQTDQRDLPLGAPLQGQLAGSGLAQLFRISVPASQPLKITLNQASSQNHCAVYTRFGLPPTRGTYDGMSDGTTGQTLLVSMATAGTWYVLVYADNVTTPGSFTIEAQSAPVFLDEVTPTSLANNSDGTLTLTGAGFDADTVVELVDANGIAYGASWVEADSFDQVTVSFGTNSVPPGTYSVRVSGPGNASATLTNAFTVISGGQPHLKTDLVVPSSMGWHVPATLYVEYGNDGSAPMPSPLLVVTATVNGREGALLTLDASRQGPGFWTSAQPEGFTHSVQILASGQAPGVLQPGESFRVPIYYAGWQQPWKEAPIFDFSLGVLTGDNTNSVDWSTLKDGMRPSAVNTEAWEAIFASFTNGVGATWGGYVSKLDDNASYLGRLGERVVDVGQLLAFELQQADSLSPVSTLASAVDAAMEAPGLPLTFSRVFSASISQRRELGPFGYGWSHNWQLSASNAPDGTVRISGPVGSRRVFQPDSRSGAYFTQAGDHGSLRSVGAGIFNLTEANGVVYSFRADGKLDYVADPNGNRITAGYTGDQLTSLSHSSGQSLQIAYYETGRIQSITDSVQRQAIFYYDDSGEHLTAVQDYTGVFTTNMYVLGQGIAKEHALQSITYPSGTHRYYDYGVDGRLSSTWRDGNAEPVWFGYDTGIVMATNGVSSVTKYFFDHRGLPVRTEDALGNAVHLDFDDNYNLVGMTDPAGRATGYGYDSRGNLTSSTDAMRNPTRLGYTSTLNRLALLTDANGNPTRYGYDVKGNLQSITYADNSAESWGQDEIGNTLVWTNRRGQAIYYTNDASGRLLSEVHPSGKRVDYSYDGHGNLTNCLTSDPVIGITNAIQMSFDERDRMTNILYPNGRWLAFTYCTCGRRESMQDHLGHRTDYHYDNVGRLEALTDETGAQIIKYYYDSAGRVSGKELGNGNYTTNLFDNAGQLLHAINYRADGRVNSRFDYTYDNRGRREAMTTLDGMWTYHCDDAGQLTNAVFVSTNPLVASQDFTYQYDAAGNRVRTITNGVFTAYVANRINRYTQVGNTTNTYDADGNLIQEASPDRTRTYTYDEENKLVGYIDLLGGADPDVYTFDYDPFGNRTSVVHNGQRADYVNDPADSTTVAEYGADGNLVTRYRSGLGVVGGVDSDGNPFYQEFDGKSSAVGVADASGKLVNQYGYGPFGERVSASEAMPNPIQFQGEVGVRRDENGMLSKGPQYYIAGTGKWLEDYHVSEVLEGSVESVEWFLKKNADASWLEKASPYFDKLKPLGKVIKGAGHIVDVIGLLSDLNKAVNGTETEKCKVEVKDGITAEGMLIGTLWGMPGFLVGSVIGGEFGKFVAEGKCEGNWGGLQGTFNWLNKNATTSSVHFVLPQLPVPSFLKPFFNWITKLLGSWDPNDKICPAGFGTNGFLRAGAVMPYRIDFENEADASAPAQQVVVTDPLDPNLDWDSFELAELGFGDQVISIPPHSQYFEGSVPMTYNGVSFEVQVDAGIDLESGEVFAHFFSVDPVTGLPPDVTIGFLPPEDGTGRGQGHVSFTIHARTNLVTGTAIRNVAEVSFDNQTIIRTDQIDPLDPSKGFDAARGINTIDAGAPTSQVLALPATTTQANFLVSWSGADETNGSGVAAFDIFVSTDGGAWSLWQSQTTNTFSVFSGAWSHSYAFVSVATDNVGNREAQRTNADTTTLVIGNAAPAFQSVSCSNGAVLLTWTTIPGRMYQLQSAQALTSTNWSNLGGILAATNDTLFSSDIINSTPQRFYRVVLLP
jgi:YD repeat-containing protein